MNPMRGDHYVGAPARTPARFVEHGRCCAGAPRVAEIDAEQDAAPCLGGDSLQHLHGVGSGGIASAHCSSLAMTWTSAPGSWSMIRSTTVGRRRFKTDDVIISPTTTCSTAESRAAWITAAATSEPPRTANEAPSCVARLR